jgi:hypothetical protein
MKVEWHAGDIRPGRIVGKPGRDEQWLIGYRISDKDNVYCLISYNADGFISAQGTKEEIANHLNAAGEFPAELLKLL